MAATTFKKDPTMKYTTMCIYIDKHMPQVTKPYENDLVETTIVEYLYHIVYALACKKQFFKRWQDYDEFALYSASQLYVMLRNKYMNVGKVIHGKEVKPIKSCLNYIKAILYPLKVDYQNQNFRTVLNPEVDERWMGYGELLRDDVRSQYRTPFLDDVNEIMVELPTRVKKILKTTPYRNDPIMMRKLYISCMLTFISYLTIPNKIKNRWASTKKEPSDKSVLDVFGMEQPDIVLWHLPEHMRDYVQILFVRLKRVFGDELQIYRNRNDLSDEVVDTILKTAMSTYDTDQSGD